MFRYMRRWLIGFPSISCGRLLNGIAALRFSLAPSVRETSAGDGQDLRGSCPSLRGGVELPRIRPPRRAGSPTRLPRNGGSEHSPHADWRPPLNSVVCISHVPDTESRIKVSGDGRRIDETGLKFIVSPFDEYAL